MNCRVQLILSLVVLLSATWAGAQTTGYHFRMGARPTQNMPPREVDMRWANGGPYGPAEGSMLQVFILAGKGWSEKKGETRQLPLATRAGSSRLLMFDDGRWQPLKPVTLQFGSEIGFGQFWAQELQSEAVGLILAPSGVDDNLVAMASRALNMVPCLAVAVVTIGSVDEKWIAQDILRTRLGAHDLQVVHLSQEPGSGAGGTSAEMALRYGEQAALRLLQALHINKEDK